VEQLLSGIRLDIAFIGVNALSVENGASTHDEREAAVNRMMASRATRAVVVADSSKIGEAAFAFVGGPELFGTVITDAGIGAADRDALESSGHSVLIAP
jgi:DeoR family transcriptional regulator of aga operon